MPFKKYNAPKIIAPPTFAQFLKTVGKGVEGKTKFQVDVVWLPGRFDNVTLQTHAFRYICDPNHDLYDEMQEYLKGRLNEDADPKLSIIIDSVKDRVIDLSEDPKVMGKWEKLGSTAFKFKNP